MQFPMLSISEVSTCNVTRITFRVEYGNVWLVFVWPLLLELIKQNDLLSIVVFLFRSCSQLGVSSAVVDTGVMTPVHLPTLFPACPCNSGYLYSYSLCQSQTTPEMPRVWLKDSYLYLATAAAAAITIYVTDVGQPVSTTFASSFVQTKNTSVISSALQLQVLFCSHS